MESIENYQTLLESGGADFYITGYDFFRADPETYFNLSDFGRGI
jgi:hypothetical protein